jgi:hypothetical protein
MALPIDYRSPTTRDLPDPDKRVRPGFVVLLLLGVGVLATVVTPKYDNGHGQGGAKVTATKSDLASMCDAVNRFAADHGRLPTAAEGLSVLALERDRQRVHTWRRSARTLGATTTTTAWPRRPAWRSRCGRPGRTGGSARPTTSCGDEAPRSAPAGDDVVRPLAA